MKYISVIESFYPSFSKQEKKIADFFLKTDEDVCLLSLQEITKKISVSEATIVRFVRKMGFKGFVNFKLEIAKETSSISRKKSKDFIENIEKNIANTVTSTKNLINKKDIEKVINLIIKADKIYIFGLGASGMAAKEMQNRFLRYGKILEAPIDNHFQVMYSSIVTNKDLLFIISLSGETSDLIYPVTLAKENGCKVVVITNYILSPLAKLGDIVLLTSGRENPLDGGSLTSKISQLYVIDVLATGYALKNEENAEKTKSTMALAIANKNK